MQLEQLMVGFVLSDGGLLSSTLSSTQCSWRCHWVFYFGETGRLNRRGTEVVSISNANINPHPNPPPQAMEGTNPASRPFSRTYFELLIRDKAGGSKTSRAWFPADERLSQNAIVGSQSAHPNGDLASGRAVC